MGGFKFTGMAAASANGEALVFGATTPFGGAVTGITDLTTTGNTILGDAATDTLNVGAGGIVKDASGNTSIGGSLAPTGDASQSLGLAAKRWLSIFGTEFSDGVAATGQLVGSTGTTVRIAGGSSYTAVTLSIGGVAKVTVNANGLGVGAAPAAGIILDLTGAAASNAFSAIRAVAGQTARWSIASNGSVPGSTSFDLQSGPTGDVDILQRANARLSLYTNSLERIQITSAGNIVANAPASGVTMTLAGFAGSDVLVANGGTSGSFRVNTTGVPYGTALHNNAGAVTGTVNQYIASGTYTPTLTNVANVAVSVAGVCQWIRVGNVVTVSGQVQVDPTAGTTFTEVDMSFPIASNITTASQAAGVSTNSTTLGQFATVIGDPTNDRAALLFTSDAGAANAVWYFHYTYLVN
jgi:hypothetical protein